ncbi:MAG TPA: rod shape-determining protein MreC [Bryobacteraceae bacterium]|nr:rod shape-determining protein MreC [Bryobacteraceae bacterium]
MDLLSRYRNVTVLALVIFAQLILLGYQVKSNQDIRLIRVWAVTAVTPIAKLIDTVRGGTVDSLGRYVNLHNLADENQQLSKDVGRLKLENQYLKSELRSADRAVALGAFQARDPSKTLPARVIGLSTSASSRVVFIDRGSLGGVMRGMAVITPDGIVGKVIAAYPTASQVLLLTDPTFAAGVISQKHRVRGTLVGLGQTSKCMVEYIQNEEKVDAGEWFYTTGDDGVFPKGLPVGTVASAQPGQQDQMVYLAPSGLQGGLEEVLVILEGVHQPIPEGQAPGSTVHLQTPAPDETAPTEPGAPTMSTDADRMRQRYQRIGAAENHTFGQGLPGSKPPDFNLDPDAAAAKARAAATPSAAPAATAKPTATTTKPAPAGVPAQ